MTKNGMLLVFALVLAVLKRYEKSSKKRYKSARRLKEKIVISEISEAATQLAQYEKELSK